MPAGFPCQEFELEANVELQPAPGNPRVSEAAPTPAGITLTEGQSLERVLEDDSAAYSLLMAARSFTRSMDRQAGKPAPAGVRTFSTLSEGPAGFEIPWRGHTLTVVTYHGTRKAN